MNKKNVKMGYTMNHEDQTIVVTKAFNKQASIPGTSEFRALMGLRKLYPDYTITMRTATVSERKERHKGLNREFIEKYISRLSNAEEALAEFHRFVEYYGTEVESKKESGKKEWKVPYGKMKSWFLKKYPNYQEVDFAV